jgi:transposase
MPYVGGLDWGSAGHAVCVVDQAGAVVLSLEVAHDAAGLAELRRQLERLAPAGAIPIAIERPSGLIVEALSAAGHPVVPLHPNVVKACRPRYRAAAGKSDPGDAYMLADILRTDGHRFRPLQPCSDDLKALRALVRGRDDLVAERVAMANRLRSLLDSFWPGAATVFADVDSPIALAFLQRYPAPEAATRLGEKRLKAFLASRSYSGRRTPAELLARLRTAPTGFAGAAEADAKGEMVRALAAVLDRLVSEIAKLTGRIEHAIAELPDGRIVMSFPRAGRICAAQILAEIGDVRGRASRPATSSPPRPASARSPTPPANAAASSSAGPATTGSAKPSPASPATPGTPRPGPPMSTSAPAPVAVTIPTPSASSPAPGSASSGAPGPTAQPTTQRSTPPPSRSTKLLLLDTGCLMSPP